MVGSCAYLVPDNRLSFWVLLGVLAFLSMVGSAGSSSLPPGACTESPSRVPSATPRRRVMQNSGVRIVGINAGVSIPNAAAGLAKWVSRMALGDRESVRRIEEEAAAVVTLTCESDDNNEGYDYRFCLQTLAVGARHHKLGIRMHSSFQAPDFLHVVALLVPFRKYENSVQS